MCVYLAGKSTNRKTQHKEEKLIRLIITQGILHPKELRYFFSFSLLSCGKEGTKLRLVSMIFEFLRI